MKILNKCLFASFILLIILSIILYLGIINEIGDISSNKIKSDRQNFKVDGHIYQYYQSSAKYKGERKAFRDDLLYREINITSIKNGWITIRFIINDQGEADRFRFFCIDENYDDKKINAKEEKHLLSLMQSLKKWEAGNAKGEKVNSYYQITFKVENGKAIDIF